MACLCMKLVISFSLAAFCAYFILHAMYISNAILLCKVVFAKMAEEHRVQRLSLRILRFSGPVAGFAHRFLQSGIPGRSRICVVRLRSAMPFLSATGMWHPRQDSNLHFNFRYKPMRSKRTLIRGYSPVQVFTASSLGHAAVSIPREWLESGAAWRTRTPITPFRKRATVRLYERGKFFPLTRPLWGQVLNLFH